MRTLANILEWLSFLDSPFVHWPLAIALLGLILWRLRWRIKDRVTSLVAWLGNRKNLRLAICVGLAPIGLIWFWLLVEAITEVWVLTSGVPQVGSGKEIADANRNRVQAIFFGVGLIGALLAAIIVPVRLWFQYRQTTTAEQGHITDRLTKAIEQLGAEKTQQYLNRTIYYEIDNGQDVEEHEEFETPDSPEFQFPDGAKNIKFGSWESTSRTVPNLEVRLGAIYALERIAEDSERDHITVMETLCAYVRENAPASEAKDHDFGVWPDFRENASQEELDKRARVLEQRRLKLNHWIDSLPPPRVDIQAALTVIGRRSGERIEFERRQEQPFRLDLRNTNLRKANLTHANLDNALLTHARMEAASLEQARMEAANLEQARMERAYLSGARMEAADLMEARMEGANFWQARMEGAKLWRAQMEGAKLMEVRMKGAKLWQAQMEGADFVGAQMQGADLREARMKGTDLGGAHMEAADLREARVEGAILHSADLRSAALTETFAYTSVRAANLSSGSATQEILNNVFGDTKTNIPDGLERPEHWDNEAIKHYYNDPKFEAWLESRRKTERAEQR